MTRFTFYLNYLVCLICTLIAFELCWIGAKYVIEGEVIHTYLDHFIAVCGSWYLARDTMKLWVKLRIKAQKAQHSGGSHEEDRPAAELLQRGADHGPHDRPEQ